MKIKNFIQRLCLLNFPKKIFSLPQIYKCNFFSNLKVKFNEKKINLINFQKNLRGKFIKNKNFKNWFLKQIESFNFNLIHLKHTLIFLNFFIIIIILCFLGILIAYIIEDFVLDPPLQTFHYATPFSIKKSHARSYDEFSSIVSLNIFNAKIEQEKNDPQKFSITPLDVKSNPTLKSIIANLELQGTIIWGGNQFALINNKKKHKEAFFGIGDYVFETKAIIHEVKDNKVWLRLDKNIDVLEYIPPTTKNNEIISHVMGGNQNDSKYHIQKNGESEFILKRSDVEKALNDMPNLMMQARVVPVIKGSYRGFFEIKYISPGSLYQKLGLKNNDIIQSVNGESVNNIEKAMNLLSVLRNESQINIQVVRNNVPVTLSYIIN